MLACSKLSCWSQANITIPWSVGWAEVDVAAQGWGTLQICLVTGKCNYCIKLMRTSKVSCKVGQYSCDKPLIMKYDWSVWSCDNIKNNWHIWRNNLSSFGEMKTCFLKNWLPHSTVHGSVILRPNHIRWVQISNWILIFCVFVFNCLITINWDLCTKH